MLCKIKSGDTFTTRHCGDFKVVNYHNAHHIDIKFIETGYETTVQSGQIRRGDLQDKLLPAVYGVGIIGDNPTRVGGVLLKEYSVWAGILRRCYDEKWHLLKPTYAGCTTSENFKQFGFFKGWYESQIGHNQDMWHLDKDILIKGNKLYSEYTCCFVPCEINSLFIKRDNARGNYPIGVHYSVKMGKYISQISKFKRVLHLGSFSTPEEAFFAYKEAKEQHIKEVANKWKDQIDPKVYVALMNWTIEITD